jgi:hypothetical protein
MAIKTPASRSGLVGFLENTRRSATIHHTSLVHTLHAPREVPVAEDEPPVLCSIRCGGPTPIGVTWAGVLPDQVPDCCNSCHIKGQLRRCIKRTTATVSQQARSSSSPAYLLAHHDV